MVHKATPKSAPSRNDRILLWMCGLLVAGGGAAYFIWIEDWQAAPLLKLTLTLNVPVFCLLAWRLRDWFRHWSGALVFFAWMALHVAAFVGLTLAGLPLVTWLVLMPLEIAVVLAGVERLAGRLVSEVARHPGNT